MADVPPTLWFPLGQLTSIVRYVFPDQTTETSIAPAPVNPNWFDDWSGGLR
jgi:hypothetical protein